jgi:hypothetical protein
MVAPVLEEVAASPAQKIARGDPALLSPPALTEVGLGSDAGPPLDPSGRRRRRRHNLYNVNESSSLLATHSLVEGKILNQSSEWSGWLVIME